MHSMSRPKSILSIVILVAVLGASIAAPVASAQSSSAVSQYQEEQAGGGGGGGGGFLPFTGFLPTTLALIGIGAIGGAFALRRVAGRTTEPG